MALSPLSALKAHVATVLERPDPGDIYITNLVKGAEDHINAEPRLKCRAAETIVDITPDSEGVATLPADFNGLRFLSSMSSPSGAMTQIAPAAAVERYGTLVSSAYPVSYAIIGNEVYTYGKSTVDLRIIYYPRLDLQGEDDTNWLLSTYPMVYVYATLVQAAYFTFADERIQLFGGLYEDLVSKIASNDAQARYMGSSGVIRGPTP